MSAICLPCLLLVLRVLLLCLEDGAKKKQKCSFVPIRIDGLAPAWRCLVCVMEAPSCNETKPPPLRYPILIETLFGMRLMMAELCRKRGTLQQCSAPDTKVVGFYTS